MPGGSGQPRDLPRPTNSLNRRRPSSTCRSHLDVAFAGTLPRCSDAFDIRLGQIDLVTQSRRIAPRLTSLSPLENPIAPTNLQMNRPSHRHTITDAHYGLAVAVPQRRLHRAIEIPHLLCRRLRKAPSPEHRKDHLPRRKWFMGHSEHVQGMPKQSAPFEHAIPLIVPHGRDRCVPQGKAGPTISAWRTQKFSVDQEIPRPKPPRDHFGQLRCRPRRRGTQYNDNLTSPFRGQLAGGVTRWAGERSPCAPCYAFSSGSATNLVTFPDFTRISTVRLPALVRSAISLLTSDGLETVLPATSRMTSPICMP
jgi:hypothetical protein